MRTQRDHRQYLFVVRIWLEAGPEQASTWRGMIEHVPFGLRMYFTSLNDLSDFIALRLDELTKPGQGEEEA